MHLLKNCIFLTLNEARDNDVFREKRGFCLFSHNAFFKDRRFGRIDSCSIIFGEHNCVRSFYVNETDNYTYKMQQRPALQFKNCKKFANLLPSLYLLLKENNVKQAIFDEVWRACDLSSLFLIKVAVTRWFTNNKATLCDWWGLLLQLLIKSISVNVNYLHQDNNMIFFSWLHYKEHKYTSCTRLNYAWRLFTGDVGIENFAVFTKY